jgi:hypothetical protein
MKKTMDVPRAVALGVALALVLAGLASAEDWRRLMTQGKLDADLGKHGEAAAAFQAIADDHSAPSALRWEAGVRLGLARSAAGDPAGSAAAFRGVLASYGGEPEARDFLTRAVASTVPGKIWPDFRDDFEELLRTARVVSQEELAPGARPLKVNLREGDVELSAIWRPARLERFRVASPRWEPEGGSHLEFAAYVVDKMLHLDMVPPTVKRALEGEEGTFQLWIYACRDMASVSRHPSDDSAWGKQTLRMRAFDYLIGNENRNARTILVDPSWQMVLIDHALGFCEHCSVAGPPQYFDRRMVERLRQLTRPVLQARLNGVLTEGQVDALLERRDTLLSHVETLITEKGEEAVLF